MSASYQSFSRRAWSRRLGVLAFALALVCCASLAQAQVTTDPHAVTFLASADHNTIGTDGQPIVTRYDLEFCLAGTSQPSLVLNLGKPAPAADGTITVDFWSMLSAPPMPGQLLEAHVAAVGPAGKGDSTPSNQFMFSAVGSPDTTAPILTITAPTSAVTFVTSTALVALGGTASDNVGVTQVSWANNRGGSGTAAGTTSWSASVALQAGANVITVTARDAVGNTATDTLTVTYSVPDTTAPAITITSPTSATTFSTSTTPLAIGGTASDNVGVTQVSWANDRGGSGAVTWTTGWSASVALQSGANVITFTARDAAGNTATDTLTVTYTAPDTTAPVVSITAPTSAATYATATTPLALGGTASDNVGVTQVSWANNRGGSGTAAGTTAWSASVALQSGTNVITVTARDLAGNASADTLTVTYTPPADTQAPSLTVTSHTNGQTVTTSSILLAGTATDTGRGGSGIKSVTVNGTRATADTTTGSGTASWSQPLTLAAGANLITVVATDNSTNQNTTTQTLTITYSNADPLLSAEWFLKPRTSEPAGINVFGAWPTTRGRGIVIGIASDGLQWAHPDLLGNYQPALSRDFNDNDADPTPLSTHPVGTAAAGVAAAAADNGIGGAGVAPEAGLAGLRLTAAAVSDGTLAAAMTHQLDAVQVVANLWGPASDGRTLGGPGPFTAAAIENAIKVGRGGLGRILLWPVGDGRANSDNCNFNGFANSRFAIAVGSVDDTGMQAAYSSPCSALLVTAPSSGGSRALTTTDLTGAPGYNQGDYTSAFGGTPAATAVTSGVTALVLARNPALTWRDVQDILRRSSVRLQPTDAGWTTSTYPHSEAYGFGLVDAQKAVELAGSWTNLANERALAPIAHDVSRAIPDNNATGISDSINVGTEYANFNVEHVEVEFNATHPYRGDLEVTLTSPAGVVSHLATPRPNDAGHDFTAWRFTTVRHWGETASGVWTLKVANRAGANVGTWTNWTLRIYGTGTDAPGTGLPPTTASGKQSPANGATVSRTVTLQWAALPDAGYSVCWNTTNSGKCDGMWYPNGGAAWRTLSGLAPGTYYWQVRVFTPSGTVDADGGAWWSFTVAPTQTSTPPVAFSKDTPVLGATGQGTTVALFWETSANADSYEYCVSTISGTCTSWQAGPPWSTVSGLSAGITYYWQVRARNTAGTTEANASAWWSFTTGSGTGGFGKVAPTTGAAGLGSAVTLQWGAAADAGYFVCWDTTNNNQCDGMWYPNGGATRRTLVDLVPGTYYWQVRAFTANGVIDAEAGTWWSFTVSGTPPSTPPPPPVMVAAKLAPTSGVTVQSSTVTLQWAALPNAGYSVCWNTTNSGKCDGMWYPNGGATWRMLPGLAPGTYYWQVRVYTASGIGDADGGTWWSFTVK